MGWERLVVVFFCPQVARIARMGMSWGRLLGWVLGGGDLDPASDGDNVLFLDLVARRGTDIKGGACAACRRAAALRFAVPYDLG